MLLNKFCGLAISFLIGITPVNFEFGSPIEFPITREEIIYWKTSYEVYDLGARTPADSAHEYIVKYDVDIYCPTASCNFNQEVEGYRLDDNHLVYSFNIRYTNKTPLAFYTLMGNDWIKTGRVTNVVTYQNSGTLGMFNIQYQYMGSSAVQTGSVYVFTSPISQGDLLNDLDYRLNEFSNLYFAKEYLIDPLNNKNVPTSVMNTYKNYIDNGNYSQAINYITNYYYSQMSYDNDNVNTAIDNYVDKETDLQTLIVSEDTFTTSYDTKFQNEITNVSPTSAEVINQTHFINSANWVKTQFDRINTKTPFLLTIRFSLLLGFALAIIGRIRNA